MTTSPDPSPRDWDRVRWEDLDPRHGRMRMERVLHLVPPGGLHLDAGTGNGDGSLLLGRRVDRFVGLEYGMKSAVRASGQGCAMTRGDVRQLPFADAAFDSITCLDVLEHVPRPAEAICELARVLRPEGVLILQTPNRELFKERVLRVARAFGRRRKQPYDRPLPRQEIRRLLHLAELEVVAERRIRCWDDHAALRTVSWSRLFLCRHGLPQVSTRPSPT